MLIPWRVVWTDFRLLTSTKSVTAIVGEATIQEWSTADIQQAAEEHVMLSWSNSKPVKDGTPGGTQLDPWDWYIYLHFPIRINQICR